jgi:hypothetical protein
VPLWVTIFLPSYPIVHPCVYIVTSTLPPTSRDRPGCHLSPSSEETDPVPPPDLLRDPEQVILLLMASLDSFPAPQTMKHLSIYFPGMSSGMHEITLIIPMGLSGCGGACL